MKPIKNESTQMLEIWQDDKKIGECSLNATREQWSLFWGEIIRLSGCLPQVNATAK